MKVKVGNSVGYGLSDALTNIPHLPIVARRAPTVADFAPVGQIWVNTVANEFFVLTSIEGGAATWATTPGGVFVDLTVANDLTVGNDAAIANDLTVGNTLVVANDIASTNGDITSGGSITSVGGMQAGGILTAAIGIDVTVGDVDVTNGDVVIATAATGITLPGGVRVITGNGSPNGAIAAAAGSLYLRLDPAGATSRAYINTDNAMTWTNITCAA